MDEKDIKIDLEKMPNESINDIFLPEGQKITVNAAIDSISDAWNLISPKLGIWILLGIIYSVISLGLEFVPYLAFILSNILEPILIAGIISICHTQKTTGKAEIGRLFYGFQYKFSSLLVVGLVAFGINLIGYTFSALIDGDDLYQVVFGDIYSDINLIFSNEDSSSSSFLSLFFGIITLFLSVAYTFFAPALIIFNDFSVKKSLLVSYNAVCKNPLGILLFFSLSIS
ncbi:membrane protein [Xenorhabdus mauleonii]|uniref:Membrane protein n=1 Tax=Xenorhabdus mauleonii TaxID=351675 RepID=A0A1I3I2Z3_9GAMM|nr:BPSS1780 family membrane protein [Xenorhabdus mauleonii]PHM40174.1 membrane protein [Xenorhabdus mauleonii]SFI42193.1 hypothetical protein SAMN05421680_101169 [Xenorhabdus mauleonii]